MSVQSVVINGTTVEMEPIKLDDGGIDKPSKWVCLIKINGKSAPFEYQQCASYRMVKRNRPLGFNNVPPGFKVGQQIPYTYSRTIYVHNFIERCTEAMPPKIENVLEFLALDYSVMHYPSFEEWADCFGYDPDSRKDERIYLDCRRNGDKMKQIGLHHLLEYINDDLG